MQPSQGQAFPSSQRGPCREGLDARAASPNRGRYAASSINPAVITEMLCKAMVERASRPRTFSEATYLLMQGSSTAL